MKSGNLNFLEPSRTLQACNGTALPLPLPLCEGAGIFLNLKGLKAYGEMYVQVRSLLKSATDRDEWPAWRPGRFTPNQDPRYPLHRKLYVSQDTSKEIIVYPCQESNGDFLFIQPSHDTGCASQAPNVFLK